MRSNSKMRVAVIGAGASGLCAARHMLAEKQLVSEVVVFEQSSKLGGTWVYTESVGYDSFGLPVHTSMYKSLRTNLPKEIMGFPDFPIPDSEKSYLPAKDMLDFLQLYSDSHSVTRHIKFSHHVVSVKPANSKWEIKHKDLIQKSEHTDTFDVVMICNGHYNTPYIPKIKGMSEFKGDVMHSHDYRVPEVFRDKNVLVVGAGPSGMDIALEITAVTNRVVLSHHLQEKPKTVFPDNLVQKPDVAELCGNTVTFQDGTEEDVDVIFFCTGYLYNFPFLDPACGVTVKDNCVSPLYKHLINIDHPTMCLVGIPFYVCAFAMFDLQVRYFIRTLNGTFDLPTREKMYEHLEKEFEERKSRGYTKRQAHMMGPDQGGYFIELSSESGATALPPVLTKIHNDSSQKFLDDLVNYRNDVYVIVDDENFVFKRQHN